MGEATIAVLTEELRRRVARRKGLYSEIARRSGLSQACVSQYVNGQRPNPTLTTLVAIERALAELDCSKGHRGDQSSSAERYRRAPAEGEARGA